MTPEEPCSEPWLAAALRVVKALGGIIELWALRPTTAFAWTLEGFPRGATRWRF